MGDSRGWVGEERVREDAFERQSPEGIDDEDERDEVGSIYDGESVGMCRRQIWTTHHGPANQGCRTLP
jgi:hypothetical protein